MATYSNTNCHNIPAIMSSGFRNTIKHPSYISCKYKIPNKVCLENDSTELYNNTLRSTIKILKNSKKKRGGCFFFLKPSSLV